MNDREKVITALSAALVQMHGCGRYTPEDVDELEEAAWDALKLLETQEPRVMMLDEVIAHYSLPPVFADDFEAQEDYYEDIQPLYFEFPHDSGDPWIVHWRRHAQVASYLDEWRHSYNKKWRCWTSRPDAKVRAETPWND